ncbi:DNA repair protein RecN [Acidiphilium iwatense]|uniref:DNA repair protein RecN n=1 Tax=Acidiphilium iwatense TaxID=768198 RepID=A0ABS9DZC1_9PROT|nr:DNA repair protein RecN [Acidiphilium iwatense]MCF3946694.1 DNA repair protein RecN [Acidiphilium iwatense]
MLTALSIRDVVLIDRLDLAFDQGLTVFTGETGAGKSILLDALGLALGARADAGLIRAEAKQSVVAASFAVPAAHPAQTLLTEQGIEPGEEILLRRIVARDGKSRALINDQPVGAGLLRRVADLLIEIQGQHAQIGLADPGVQLAMLDEYGVEPGLRESVVSAHTAWRVAEAALGVAETALAEARRDEDFLRHAVDELSGLAPRADEEDALAASRQRLQGAERRAEAIDSALAELAPRERRSAGPATILRGAARVLARIAETEADGTVALALEALERAEEALAEAETLLSRASAEAEADPRGLEAIEERLFSLRAMARKHAVAVSELPELLDQFAARLATLDAGTADLARCAATAKMARAAYIAAAGALMVARNRAAERLAKAVARELPPLKLDRARFVVERADLPETQWGARGADQVRFLIATNPGDQPGAIDKVASGGELSRLLLALNVVLAGESPVGTLIFDEVDSGIGGATAAAVGERLARIAAGTQVLVVTHSPQVAARAGTHFQVAKLAGRSRAQTLVGRLDVAARREEIARMLAGETITDAARDAALSLMAES